MDNVRKTLIERTYQRMIKCERYKNYTLKDVDKAIRFMESAIMNEMLSTRGVYIIKLCSIFPDPVSRILLKKGRMKENHKFYKALNEKKAGE